MLLNAGTLHGLPVLSDSNEKALDASRKDAPDFDAAPLDAPGVAVARAGAPRLPVWLYAASIFLSAFLLFQVQPILAKLILPWFGGAAAVWVISLAFYQLAYLLGNLYAHILIQRSGPRFSTRAHALLLLASLLLLPIVPSAFWQPRGSEEPMWRILGVLAATVGVPFLLLSATSSLLQAWHTLGREDARPYRFYALSNAASLLALLSYPLLVEPLVSTHHQALIWSAGYGVFVALCSAFAFRPPVPKPRQAHPQRGPAQQERPRWRLQLLWLGLAASASALLLSITHYVSQNIAAIPLLWVVPLSLYLLTLDPVFRGRTLVFPPAFPASVAHRAGGNGLRAFAEIRRRRAGIANFAVLRGAFHLLHGLPWRNGRAQTPA